MPAAALREIDLPGVRFVPRRATPTANVYEGKDCGGVQLIVDDWTRFQPLRTGLAIACELRRLGWAHSVEVWRGGKLAGGLYGVAIGGAFFGESMFYHATDASKIALVALVERLRTQRFVLLDTQWTTPHLEQFGTVQIPKEEYIELLREAVGFERTF